MITGSKYDKTRTTTQEAACFRADVKQAIKEGVLPKGLKLSVKTDYFSGGSAIRVKITALSDTWVINDEARDYQNRTIQANVLIRTLEQMLNAYNFNDSRPEYDHFHVNFYGSVSFDHNLDAADRKALDALTVHADVCAIALDALLCDRPEAARAVLDELVASLDVLDWKERVTVPGTEVAKKLLGRLTQKAALRLYEERQAM